MAMERRFSLRTALALWIAATIGAACVLPYLAFLTPALQQAAGRLRVPVFVVILLSLAQSAVTLAVLTFAGLWAATKLGMGAPLLDHWLAGEPSPRDSRRAALTSVALGLLSGVALIAVDRFLFLPLSREGVGRLLHQRQPPAWAGLLASIEGGVTEEVQLRLFVLSFLALGVRYARGVFARHRETSLTPAVFWIANVIAAVLFGLGHLPVTARLVPLTAVVVTRSIVLNGIVGLVAGTLFWRRGIEMAMVCHFSADIVLHVAAPLLQSWLLRGVAFPA
jgi:hypothetical protein